MSNSLLRTDKEIEEIYMRHYKTVYRVCFSYMKTTHDTENTVQDTFFRLIKCCPVFDTEEHEKAWLIVTAANICKNALRHWWRKRENINDFYDLPGSETVETDDIFQAIMELPDKYKAIVFLYYYEGYSSVEIANMLKKPQSTVRNYLREARCSLKERLNDDFDEKR